MCASDVCAGVSAHTHSTAALDASDVHVNRRIIMQIISRII